MHRLRLAFAALALVAMGRWDAALAAPAKPGSQVRRQVQKPKPGRIFLERVRSQRLRATPMGNTIRFLRGKGLPVPGILYLFEYNPRLTASWQEYTQDVMRGGGLPAAQRELIAAVVSQGNECGF